MNINQLIAQRRNKTIAESVIELIRETDTIQLLIVDYLVTITPTGNIITYAFKDGSELTLGTSHT